MQLFYLENPKDDVILDIEESRHITKSLRKKEGDIINFTDGNGNLFIGKIIDSKVRRIRIKIIKREKKQQRHNYYLHIAIAPTKNIERFEWFLEKATEIGINEITPIICEHSERKKIKITRCKNILIAAIKQSLQYNLPILNEPIYLTNFIEQKFKGKKYIAHCKDMNILKLKEQNRSQRTLLLIGPEGDFSKSEIKIAEKYKFQAINLNKNRLRTETAGIIATHTININNI